MREGAYQTQLIKELHRRFPGCVVLKNDPSYLQGIPDLAVFYNDRWAMLEVKVESDYDRQPNQEYYVDQLNRLSFAAFIYPENQEEVLLALEQAFKSRRSARVPKR